MLNQLILVYLMPLILAGFTEFSGTLTCSDCGDCGSVTGDIELWEADTLTPDDFQDKSAIIDGKYENLKFGEFEWLPTEPYFLIKHTCSPMFWLRKKRLPDKLNCYVQTKYSFDEPAARYKTIDLDLRQDGKSEIVCQ